MNLDMTPASADSTTKGLPAESKLKRTTLISYGLGSLAPTAATEFCGAYLLLFYTELMQLDPVWVGYAFFIRMVVDALIDPCIGFISDRTRSAAGRRRPYFLWGSIPGLIAFTLTLFPPSGSSSMKFLWLTLFSTAMAICLSLTSIPHMAMSFEMSPAPRERVRIVGYRNFVESFSSLMALLSGPLLLGLAGLNIAGRVLSRADCYRIAAVSIALLGIASAFVAYRGTGGTETSPQPVTTSFFSTLKDAFRNRMFRLILTIYVLIVVANRVALAQLFLMLEHFQGKPEQETVPLLLAFYVGSLAGVTLSMLAGNLFGRVPTLRTALLLWPLSFVGLTVVRWPDPVLIAISFCMGIAFSTMLAMLGSLAPDALDIDRSLTGQRREGQFASIINLVLQLALGVGYVLTGWTLQLIGFRGGATPSAEVVLGLRISTAFFPVFLGVWAAVLMRNRNTFVGDQSISGG